MMASTAHWMEVVPGRWYKLPLSIFTYRTLHLLQTEKGSPLAFQVRQSTNTEWTILNASGKAVMHFSSRLFYGENKLNLSLQQLPAGIYYLRGTTANANSQSLKFIKL